MTSPNLRSAQAALDVARPLIVRLDERRHPEDVAADLIEGWAAVETALRAMVGGSSLGGQSLVSEVRAQGRLDYPHAHALLGFLAARDRATRPDYQPTGEDVAAARAGFQAIEAANGSGIAADTGVHRSVTPPGAVLTPPPLPPREPRRGADGPVGPAPNAAPPSYARGGARDPDPRTEAPFDADGRAPRRRGLSPALIAGVAVVLVALAGGAYLLTNRARPSSALDDGIAAYREGRRDAARGAFERAAAEQPALSMPRVYLARLARESGDVPRATAYLDTAIRLDTLNALAFREMGQLQLYANRPQLAVSFFRRAIERNGTDSVANGWMACALTSAGNTALAQRFYARAGAGEWTACQQAGAFSPPPAAGATPGAPAAAP